MTAQLGLPATWPPSCHRRRARSRCMKSTSSTPPRRASTCCRTLGYVLTALVLLLYAARRSRSPATAGARPCARSASPSSSSASLVLVRSAARPATSSSSSLSEVASLRRSGQLGLDIGTSLLTEIGPVDRPLRDRDRARRLARRADPLGDLDPSLAHPLPAPAAATPTAGSRSLLLSCCSGGTRPIATHRIVPSLLLIVLAGARDRDAAPPGDRASSPTASRPARPPASRRGSPSGCARGARRGSRPRARPPPRPAATRASPSSSGWRSCATRASLSEEEFAAEKQRLLGAS